MFTKAAQTAPFEQPVTFMYKRGPRREKYTQSRTDPQATTMGGSQHGRRRGRKSFVNVVTRLTRREDYLSRDIEGQHSQNEGGEVVREIEQQEKIGEVLGQDEREEEVGGGNDNEKRKITVRETDRSAGDPIEVELREESEDKDEEEHDDDDRQAEESGGYVNSPESILAKWLVQAEETDNWTPSSVNALKDLLKSRMVLYISCLLLAATFGALVFFNDNDANNRYCAVNIIDASAAHNAPDTSSLSFAILIRRFQRFANLPL